MREPDTFGIRVCELEIAQAFLRGWQRCFHDLKDSTGMSLSYLPGVILHGPLRMTPKIRPSRDRMNLTFDYSVGRISCTTVLVLAVSRELSSLDEILYLILEVETGRGRMPDRVVVQAELALVLFRHLPLQRRWWPKINLTSRVDKNLLVRGRELFVPIVPWSAGSVHPRT